MITQNIVLLTTLFIKTMEIPVFFLYYFRAKKRCKILIWIHFLVLCLINITFQDNQLLNIATTVFFLMTAMLYLNGEWHRKVFVVLVVYFLGMVSEVLAAIALSFIYSDNMQMMAIPERMPVANLVVLVIHTILLFIAAKLVRRTRWNKLPMLYWVSMICTPVCSGAAVFIFYNFSVGANYAFSCLLPLAIVALLVLNYINLYLFNKVLDDQRDVTMSQMQKKLIEAHNEQIDQLIYAETKTRKTRHDVSHALVDILTCMEADDQDGAVDLINKTLGGIHLITGPAQSGNLHIDGILNYEINKANGLDIKVLLEMNIPADISFDSSQVSALIGNALDNAIDACRQVTDRPREISVNIRQHFRQIFIDVSNPYIGKIVVEDGMTIASSKNVNYNDHGIGLLRMKEIVEENYGELYIETKDGVFYLSAQLGDGFDHDVI